MNKLQRTQFMKLVKEFDGRCVRCGLEGYHLDRDHIRPQYKGGSDSIRNIQPLCAWCNGSKGNEGFNWKVFRRKNGWLDFEKKLAKTHPFNKK